MHKLIMLALLAAVIAAVGALPAAAKPGSTDGKVMVNVEPFLEPWWAVPDRSRSVVVRGPLAEKTPAQARVGRSRASSATLTVCPHGCTFRQIAPAIVAASPGGTIRIAPGTYAGGFTVDKDLSLVGAGASATMIQGGGPVVKIGELFAATEPTVSIRGVTITGGVTTSGPFDTDGVVALGGGIEVPPAADFAPGATVSVANSVIRGNLVASTATVPSGDPCPRGECPFAFAGGGGIDSWGALTLTHTTVSDNSVGGPVASDADGGGILNEEGALTLSNSVVSNNHAIASTPNGRFADAGGILAFGTLAIEHGVVSSNSAELSTSFPTEVDTSAGSGGIDVFGGASATIRSTAVTGNRVTDSNLVGDASGFGGGIADGGTLALGGSSIRDNRVSGKTSAGSPSLGTVFATAGGLGIVGTATVRDSVVSGNDVGATAPTGGALAQGGGVWSEQQMTLSDDVVRGNRATARSTTGSHAVRGAGIMNFGVLDVRDTRIGANWASSIGPGGPSEFSWVARGGGIGNESFGSPPQLTLTDTTATDNALTSSAGLPVQGGGLFTAFPVSLADSAIRGNIPDDCFGVSC